MFRRRISRFAALLGVAATIGAVGGLVTPSTASPTVVGSDVHLPPPGLALDHARSSFPYHVRTPQHLPGGLVLHHVIETAPSAAGEVAHSVDMWYRSDNGDQVHIWQTDHPTLALTGKDPAAASAGEAVEIDGRTWRSATHPDFEAISFSVRYEDGVTLSLDGTLSRPTLRAIVASLR